jgi:hypothetical protein
MRLIAFTLLFISSFPKILSAQNLSSSHIMSSIGSIQNMSNNSMAVTFTSNIACLNIQNGAAVLSGERGMGIFSTNCEVNKKFNTFSIKLYPNPVESLTKVKFSNKPPEDDLFSITIWGSQGEKFITSNATGYEIYQGKIMNLSTLVSGTYIIQIESSQYKDALIFIKAN